MRSQGILRVLQRRHKQLLELQKTTITEDAINKIDNVLKELVQEIEKETNPRNIKILNQKLDQLMELKVVFVNSLNSGSIKTIVDEFIEFINHTSVSPQVDEDDQGKALMTNAARYLYLLRNSSQSLDKGKIHDPALGLELFRTYRSIIEHEDTVLSQRINWFLVTQGFLFAAVATALSVEISFPIFLFLLIISCTGFGYSRLITNPILFSFIAIDTVKKEWEDRLDTELTTEQANKLFPEQVCFDAEKIKKYLPDYYDNWKFLNWLARKPKSENYKTNISKIVRGTMIIWAILFLYILLGNIRFERLSFWRNSHYLKIKKVEKENLIQRRFDINKKSNSGFKAAICLDENEEKILAIRPTSIPFFNLSKDSANYYNNLIVPISSNTDGLKIMSQDGRLKSCKE